MKTRFITAAAATAMALSFAPAAFAQEADAGAPAQEAAPPPAASQQFSDDQISSYVSAVGEIQKIQADTTLDAQTKQTQMASAVQAAGLDVATFNAIATQSQTDTALQQKIQEHLAASQGTTPTP